MISAYRSPWQNSFVERYIGTLRRALLDHVTVLNQSHLERLLKELIKEYYHQARPHQGLEGDTPIPHTGSIFTPHGFVAFLSLLFFYIQF